MKPTHNFALLTCIFSGFTVSQVIANTNQCQLFSSFEPTARYIYKCDSNQYVVPQDLINRYCNIKGNKKTGISAEDYTVNRDLYSAFCNNGGSVTAVCLNGQFSQPITFKRGKETVKKIICRNNG